MHPKASERSEGGDVAGGPPLRPDGQAAARGHHTGLSVRARQNCLARVASHEQGSKLRVFVCGGACVGVLLGYVPEELSVSVCVGMGDFGFHLRWLRLWCGYVVVFLRCLLHSWSCPPRRLSVSLRRTPEA